MALHEVEQRHNGSRKGQHLEPVYDTLSRISRLFLRRCLLM